MPDFGPQLTSILGSTRKLASFLCGVALTAGLNPGSQAQAQSAATRITYANSIKEPATTTANAASIAKTTPTMVRSQLTDAESQETIDFSSR